MRTHAPNLKILLPKAPYFTSTITITNYNSFCLVGTRSVLRYAVLLPDHDPECPNATQRWPCGLVPPQGPCPRLKEARRCSAGVCAVIRAVLFPALRPSSGSVCRHAGHCLLIFRHRHRHLDLLRRRGGCSTAAAACGACGSQRMRPRPASPPRAGSPAADREANGEAGVAGSLA